MAKEHWMTEKCQELEELQHDAFNLHKKIKNIAEWKRNSGIGVLLNNNNNIGTEVNDTQNMGSIYWRRQAGDDFSKTTGQKSMVSIKRTQN